MPALSRSSAVNIKRDDTKRIVPASILISLTLSLSLYIYIDRYKHISLSLYIYIYIDTGITTNTVIITIIGIIIFTIINIINIINRCVYLMRNEMSCPLSDIVYIKNSDASNHSNQSVHAFHEQLGKKGSCPDCMLCIIYAKKTRRPKPPL